MHSIVLALFPLIAFIVTGYIFKQKKFLSDAFWAGAERLNYFVLFPAMLFGTLLSAQINAEMLSSIVKILSLMFGIIMLVLYGLKGLFGWRNFSFGVFVQSNIRFNTYIGLAVVSSVFHASGMILLAIVLAISIPIVNVLSVFALTERQGIALHQILLSLLKNPLILSCLMGIGFNLSGIVLWQGLTDYLQQLARCSLALGLMCVGAALQFGAFKQHALSLGLNVVSRLLFIPLLAWLICQLLHFSVLETQVFVLFFALPTASASYTLCKVLGGDSQLMAGIISLQTLISVLSLSCILAFLL